MIVVVLLVLLLGGYLVMKAMQPAPPVTTQQTTPTTPRVVPPTPAEEPEDAMMEDAMMEELTVALVPSTVNTAVAQSGTAKLEDTEDGLTVTLNVTGYASEVPQPAHIHTGACPDVGAVTHPLEDVVDGISTTVLEGVTLADLKDLLPLGINVHQSADAVAVYTSCGDIEL